MELLKITQWGKRGFFFATLVLAAFLQSAPLAIISASLLILLLLQKRFDVYIPSTISVVFVLFMSVSLILGSHFDWYERFVWLDDVLHAFYGAAFAVIGFILIQYLSARRSIKNDILIVCLFSFCFAVAGGALWEIYEFAFDFFFDGNMQRTEFGNGVTDTMHDIILETSAAFVVNLYIYAFLKSGTRSWVSNMMTEFMNKNHIGAAR